jgi:BirA family biotin operon repressor/biotin-[acetyl-CoA-carboxylase] ligase
MGKGAGRAPALRGRIVRLAVTPSTQLVARAMPVGTVVVTDHQTAGRGRMDRRWEAPPGTALLASFVVAFHPLASLAAGVAAAEACGSEVRLKWPNDLMLGGRKVAGVLAEVHDSRAIIGIGVNLTSAPEGAARLGNVDRDLLLEAIAGGLERWLAAPRSELLDAWRGLADTLGSRVRVDLGGEIVEGIAEAITGDGALVVNGRTIAAGDVVHLRPAPAPRPGSKAGSRPTSRK